MNLYLISQDVNNSYDTYDSAVVAAPNEDIARRMLPDENTHATLVDLIWCLPKDVQVKYIGLTLLPQSVICASFNAG